MSFTRGLILTLVTIFLYSCGSDGSTYKRTVTGKAGEVIVVISKEDWSGASGNSLRNILAVDYPSLPQREPSFNLINIPPSAFSEIFRSHRNIILVEINTNLNEAKYSTVKDAWAQPQIIVRVQAPSDSAASAIIEKNSELLFNSIDQIEKDRIIRNSKRYEESSIRSVVAEKFGGSPYFPSGYSIKKQTNNFIWISYETSFTNQGILIYTIPFSGKEFPSKEEIIKSQNQVLKENVPGMFDNTYMTISKAPEVVPTIKYYKYKGENFVEIRGLWDVEGDYMGGPFVEHIRYSKEPDKLIVVQGFVYAPRYKKRNYLRQVESIIYSFDWKENFSN